MLAGMFSLFFENGGFGDQSTSPIISVNKFSFDF
jgi:hypothetical protein